MTDPSWRQLADRYNTTPEEIKERLPLEWVISVAAGIQLQVVSEGRSNGLCPFHADNDPSLDIYGYGERWGCYPCNDGGDVFDFIGKFWQLKTFPAQMEKALDLLERFENEEADNKGAWRAQINRAGPVTPPSLIEIQSEVQAAYDVLARQTSKPIRDLLENKGLDFDLSWMSKVWRVGVTARGEVLAPYWDREGKLVTFKTRMPGRGGWYARKGAQLLELYGVWQLVGADAEADVWICEGETDTWLASWLLRGQGIALGLPAGAGSRIRDEWVELMRNRRVTLVFDADTAGRNAARSWWTQTVAIAREVSISFPESDLVESKDPVKVLRSGLIVPNVSGFIVKTPDDRAYRALAANGPGEILSNFTFEPTKRIDYRDTLGRSASAGFEGYFGDQTNRVTRIKSTDFRNAASLRDWAIANGRMWLGSTAKHAGALLEELQAQAPFLKEEIAVPVAGLWGHDTGHSVFVLPEEAGGLIGSAIGQERWSFDDELANYDIGDRYRLFGQKMPEGWAHQMISNLLSLNHQAVMTPIVAWMMAAPLRSLVGQFPPLAVLGASGSGKTSLLLLLMRLFWGWRGAEQNLTSTTRYAVGQASAATNALPMWWDEYRSGAGRQALDAVGQLLRDSWTASVSARGGMGENLSQIQQTAAIAPLVLSGEAAMEERSHQDRVVVVRLGRGKNVDAFNALAADVGAVGGGVVGWSILNWLSAGLDRGDPLVAAGAPERNDRQEQGVAVLEWGWEMFKRWAGEELGVEVLWDLDLAVVTAERADEHEYPEIEALLEALESEARESYGDDVPVAWIENYDEDVVAVRPRAFFRWAKSAGYVLPGGEKATIKLLTERFGGARSAQVYYQIHVVGHSLRRSGYRLWGVRAYAESHGMMFDRRGTVGGGSVSM